MGQFLVLQTDGRLKYPEITKSTHTSPAPLIDEVCIVECIVRLSAHNRIALAKGH